MTSNKQKIAQKRNWLKFRLSSMGGGFYYENLTQEEREQFTNINNIRRRLLDIWDENTKQIINNTENDRKEEN